MLENRQSQKAGDGSSQFQANTIIFQGIDEKRAREIVSEQLSDILNACSQEAREVAKERVTTFAADLVPKLVRDNLLSSLNDPSIQILIKEAQKSAASTERKDDYFLLSELLIHRIKNDKDRNIRSGVTRAISIVDEISDEALLGLTIVNSVGNYIPMKQKISDGLTILDKLYSNLFYGDLPNGFEWIEQLDILNAIRINMLGGRIKIDEVCTRIMPGYIDIGIKKGSAVHTKVIEMLKESELPLDVLCDHELREDYIRLGLVNIDQLDQLSYSVKKIVTIDGIQRQVYVRRDFNEKQKEIIKSIYALYESDKSLKEENKKAFMNLWDSYDNLKILREWWDSIPRAFEITCVGRVLAHANAQRCDPKIPNMDI